MTTQTFHTPTVCMSEADFEQMYKLARLVELSIERIKELERVLGEASEQIYDNRPLEQLIENTLANY